MSKEKPLKIQYRNCKDKLGKEPVVCEFRTDELRMFEDNICGTLRTIQEGGNKCVIEVKVIGQMDNTIDHTFESANRIYDKNGLSPTINTCGGGGLQPKVIVIGSLQDHAAIKTDGTCTTLTEAMGKGGGQTPMILADKYRIRKLTPKECWRLMAFTDEDFHKAEKVNSNTQLYRQSGKSIVVNVLEAIFKQMI